MTAQDSLKEQTIQALVIGTLALMTHYAQTGCHEGAHRIQENLQRLSAIGDLPWEFRTAVTKLAERWDLLQDAIRGSRDASPRGSVH